MALYVSIAAPIVCPVAPSAEIQLSPPSPLSIASLLNTETPVHVVLKFGGTSVAKFLGTIVDTIIPSLYIVDKQIPILVCSAQSYTIKTEGTTQRLLAAIDAALDPNVSFESEPKFVKPPHYVEAVHMMTPPPTPPQLGSPTVMPADAPVPTVAGKTVELSKQTAPNPRSIIEDILRRHLIGAKNILAPSGGKSQILDALEKDLRNDYDRVIGILQAVSTLGELSPGMKDTVISFGELMSCRAVVAALHSRSIPARLVDLTDLGKNINRSAAASIGPVQSLDETFFQELVAKVGEKIRSVEATKTGEPYPVLVATGFFGPIPGSLLYHIGRGYTDVCAALCARAVAASELQIWKEVDGIFSADPRKITNARLLPEISSNHAKLLASYGSEVVHHLAISQANALDIPIIVKNVTNPSTAGTRIVTKSNAGLASSSAPPFAVTVVNDLELVSVRFCDSFVGHPMLRVMEVLKQHWIDANNMGLDHVHSSQENVCFMIKGAESRSTEDEADLAKVVDALKQIATVSTTPGLSYLQAVLGSDPCRHSAIAWKMFGALADAGICVKSISHGAVKHGIGCIIAQGEALKAASVVHDALVQLLWYPLGNTSSVRPVS